MCVRYVIGARGNIYTYSVVQTSNFNERRNQTTREVF